MGDAIEVKPRYLEPDAPSNIVKPGHIIAPDLIKAGSPSEPLNANTRGIFTSMYENKIIILIIVIVIIIVIIVAYFILKKDEPGPEVSPKHTNTTETSTSKPTNATKPAEQNTSNPQPAVTGGNALAPEVPSNQADQRPKSTAENLANLLARSKQAERNSIKAVVTPTRNTKSEEEIMQLMEDKSGPTTWPSNNEASATRVYTNTASAHEPSSQHIYTAPHQSNTLTETVSPTTQQCDTSTVDTPSLTNEQCASPESCINSPEDKHMKEDGYCNMTLVNGRRCRNKAQNQGMCTRHSGDR